MSGLELRFLEKKTETRLRLDMSRHYSRPKGFVGRSICFGVYYNNVRYGSIVAGSALMHLPARDEFFSLREEWKWLEVQYIINCVFYHVEKIDNKYPVRNFGEAVLKLFRIRAADLWIKFYGDKVLGFESLVELPRTGEVFLRDNWIKLPFPTKGQTCKRIGGTGTDSYTGKRVWNTEELRPKWVFVRKP